MDNIDVGGNYEWEKIKKEGGCERRKWSKCVE